MYCQYFTNFGNTGKSSPIKILSLKNKEVPKYYNINDSCMMACFDISFLFFSLGIASYDSI